MLFSWILIQIMNNSNVKKTTKNRSFIKIYRDEIPDELFQKKNYEAMILYIFFKLKASFIPKTYKYKGTEISLKNKQYATSVRDIQNDLGLNSYQVLKSLKVLQLRGLIAVDANSRHTIITIKEKIQTPPNPITTDAPGQFSTIDQTQNGVFQTVNEEPLSGSFSEISNGLMTVRNSENQTHSKNKITIKENVNKETVLKDILSSPDEKNDLKFHKLFNEVADYLNSFCLNAGLGCFGINKDDKSHIGFIKTLFDKGHTISDFTHVIKFVMEPILFKKDYYNLNLEYIFGEQFEANLEQAKSIFYE